MNYEYEPHSPIKTKSIPWPRCKHCGLVYLNNGFTRWCVDKGCNNRDHPAYNRKRKG